LGFYYHMQPASRNRPYFLHSNLFYRLKIQTFKYDFFSLDQNLTNIFFIGKKIWNWSWSFSWTQNRDLTLLLWNKYWNLYDLYIRSKSKHKWYFSWDEDQNLHEITWKFTIEYSNDYNAIYTLSIFFTIKIKTTLTHNNRLQWKSQVFCKV